MAAKIPVHVHIGVTTTPLPAGRVLSEMRVVVSETDSGTYHQGSIGPGEQPVPDEAGNPHFVMDFPAVQSGESLHISVKCLDPAGSLIGTEATHNVALEEVDDPPPSGTFHQPVSIYLTA